MSQDRTEERRNPLARLSLGPRPRPGPDERDATIELLERTLADERDAAAALQKNFDALRFQLEVLERSYAKQLEDARERCAAAERALGEQQNCNAALDEELSETARALADARDLVERAWSRAGGRPSARSGEAEEAEGTINSLLSDASWLDAKTPAPDQDGHVYSQVKSDAAAADNDMLAPELVFPGGEEEPD